ncbi:MAG TPA: enoyl-CoA hydratase/isomerase family protein [Pseudomonadales bacterium]|nr:enoyl-CoA hydratase/isomerase family protein [Pseudomonadales bacterium]
MSYEHLEVERDGAVTLVHLNRPRAANALSRALMEELIDCAESFHDDVDTRAVVFAGRGRHFCAGADLTEDRTAGRSKLEARRRGRIGADLIRAVRAIAAPTIAAIEGAALGGGACIATACDFRVAAEDASCGYPEVNLGMNLQWQALPHCVRLIGPARAKRMIGLGDRHPAPELLAWGFIDEMTPPGAAVEGALALARACAARPPIAIQMIKQSVNAVSDAFDAAIMHMDQDQFALTATMDDFAEGIRAFRERRTPSFSGD